MEDANQRSALVSLVCDDWEGELTIGQDVAAACGNTGILELFKRDSGLVKEDEGVEDDESDGEMDF
jgi:hypothetical protein